MIKFFAYIELLGKNVLHKANKFSLQFLVPYVKKKKKNH